MRGKLRFGILILAVVAFSILLILVRTRHRTDEDQVKQKREQPGAPTKREQQLDEKAFYDTYRITDQGRRLEALEKFLADFPKSSQIGSAKQEMFKITVKNWPKDRKRVLDAANRLVGPPAQAGGGSANLAADYQFMARELLSAGIFLADAERFASKSIEDFDTAQFSEGLKKMYAEWKKPIPSDEVVNEKYLKELAAYRATLGRVYLDEGKKVEGEKILKQAYEADPLLAQAAIGLAEIAKMKRDDASALQYLSTASLTAGWRMGDARGRFEALYRETHNGSIDGADALLDARYRKLFPPPVQVEPYHRTSARSDRVVLAEMFDGAG